MVREIETKGVHKGVNAHPEEQVSQNYLVNRILCGYSQEYLALRVSFTIIFFLFNAVIANPLRRCQHGLTLFHCSVDFIDGLLPSFNANMDQRNYHTYPSE